MNQMRNIMNNMGTGMPGMNSTLPGPLGNIMNLMQMFSQFSQNPICAIMGMGHNVPSNIQGNMEATVNYLRNSGQMTEQQFNQFSQLANSPIGQQLQNAMRNR